VLKSILNYCFLLTIGVFLVWGQNSVYAGIRIEKKLSSKELTSCLSEDIYHPNHYPSSIPFQCSYSPNEEDSSNENEEDEHSEDQWAPFIWHDSTTCLNKFNFSLACYFFQLNQSFVNRSTVSLIILYQSWKSFLI